MKKTRAVNKKKAGRGRLYFRAAVVLSILMLAGGGYAYIRFGKEVMPVSDIVFLGNKYLSAEEMQSLLKLRKGDNFFRYSSHALARNLLHSTWIRNVSVRKEFMDRKLFIRVEEREPFVIIKKDGRLWISDIEGTVLQGLSDGSAFFLPILEADPKGHPDTFREAVVLAKLLKEKGYFAKSVSISATGAPETLSVIVDGVKIVVGYGDYEQKLRRLRELETEIARRGISAESIDLRFANRVVVSPFPGVKK